MAFERTISEDSVHTVGLGLTFDELNVMHSSYSKVSVYGMLMEVIAVAWSH